MVVSSLLHYQLLLGIQKIQNDARQYQNALITLPSRLRVQGREGHSKELDEIDRDRRILTFCLALHPTGFSMERKFHSLETPFHRTTECQAESCANCHVFVTFYRSHIG